MCCDSLPAKDRIEKSNIFSMDTWSNILRILKKEKQDLVLHFVGAPNTAELQLIENCGVSTIIYEYRNSYLEMLKERSHEVVYCDYDFEFPLNSNMRFVVLIDNGQSIWKLFNWIYGCCRQRLECNLYSDYTLFEAVGFDSEDIEITKICDLKLHYDQEVKRKFACLKLTMYHSLSFSSFSFFFFSFLS